MKKLFLSLGLSVTILLSAAFAQPSLEKRTSAPAAHSRLKHIATTKSDKADKALVRLIVGTSWAEGSGYQMLLDSKAELCNDVTPPQPPFGGGLNQNSIEQYYAKADFKIPAEASPVVGTTSVLENRKDSVYINGGVYDFLITHPYEETEGECYVAIAADNAIWNDFLFLAGYTYTFLLEGDAEKETETYSASLPINVSVKGIHLPTSCNVAAENEVKLLVSNNGTSDIDGYTVWYKFGNGDTVKESVSAKLTAGNTAGYTFTQKVSIAKLDSTYVISAGIKPIEGDSDREDDARTASFAKHETVSQIPHTFDLEADLIPGKTETWWVEKESISASETGVPLFSKCFNLTAGKYYRLSYRYFAGNTVTFPFPKTITESYHIGFGLSSKPVWEWNIVHSEENVITDDWTTASVILSPTANGSHAFYFQPDLSATLYLYDITLSEVADNNVVMKDFSIDLPRLMPESQVNNTFAASVTVLNAGQELIDTATVFITLKNDTLGMVGFKNLDADSIVSAKLNLRLSGLKANETVKLTATAFFEKEIEEQTKDNIIERSITVSDSVMAYDFVTKDMYSNDYAIGNEVYSIGCGTPFTLKVKDTLTAVSIGWGPISKDLPFVIRVQKWDGATCTLGNILYESSFLRGVTAGQREYRIPAIIMEPGDYIVSVIQSDDNFFGLITDRSDQGVFYNSMLQSEPGETAEIQDDLGYPAIRTVWGHNGKPLKKDIVVSAITKPDEPLRFSVNEPVIAKVGNQGYEKAEAPLFLMVDGEIVDQQTLSLPAYGFSQVTFTADLSKQGAEYHLVVFSSLAEDENHANDTVEKFIRTKDPVSPYIMDFEDTEDFAIDNFNPAWKPVDVDKDSTYAIKNIYFPHIYEPMAFIAFNPDKVTPQLTIRPHSGERFGAAYNARTKQSNDWLISPKLRLPVQNARMTFFVRSYTPAYGLEKYNVWVSETDDNLESFVQIGKTESAPDLWEEVIVDLSAYAGKEVHLAIQGVSNNSYCLMIDDIVVSRPVGNEGDHVSAQLSLYPNPAHEMISIKSSDASINQVTIFTATGMQVQRFGNLNTQDFRYNVKKLTSGIYFALVQTEQGSAVLKFVIR